MSNVKETALILIEQCAHLLQKLTPRQTIHEHRSDCAGFASAFEDCQGDELYNRPCIFYPYRIGNCKPSAKLIRKFCLDCMGGNQKLVRECRPCPVLRYRIGENLEQCRQDRFKSEKQPPHEAISRQESTIGVAPISKASYCKFDEP